MGIKSRNKAMLVSLSLTIVLLASVTSPIQKILGNNAPRASSEDVLVDKVFTFLAPFDSIQFDDLYLYEDVNHYILLEIVTPHKCEVNVSVVDPDLDIYEIFKTEVNISQSDRWFEIPFGTALDGNYTFIFSVISELNLNIYVKISYDRDLKCLYDIIAPESLQRLELYQVNKFYDGTIAEHNVMLKTDVSYEFYIGRVSAIGGTPNGTEITVDYGVFDPNNVEFVIYQNKTVASVGSILKFDFGTAVAGIYTIKIAIHSDVDVVNVAYAIVEDYTISTGDNGTDPNPTPTNGTTSGEFLVPIEWTINFSVAVGGVIALLVVIGSVRKRRTSVSLK